MNDYESIGRYAAQMTASGWELIRNHNGAAALREHGTTGKRVRYADAQLWWWLSGAVPASEVGG